MIMISYITFKLSRQIINTPNIQTMEIEANQVNPPQMDVEEMEFHCPQNHAHMVIGIARLRKHLLHCKDLRGRKIYYCQFFFGHLFLDQEEKNIHQATCPRRNGQKVRDDLIDYYDRSADKMELTARQLEILVEPNNVEKNLYFWKHYGQYIKEDKVEKKKLKEYKERIQRQFEEKHKQLIELSKNPVQKFIEENKVECAKTGQEFNLSMLENIHVLDLISKEYFQQQVIKLFRLEQGEQVKERTKHLEITQLQDPNEFEVLKDFSLAKYKLYLKGEYYIYQEDVKTQNEIYTRFVDQMKQKGFIATNYKDGNEWVTIACCANVGDIGNFIPKDQLAILIIPLTPNPDQTQTFTNKIQDKEQYDIYMQQIQKDFERKMQEQKIKDELEMKKKEYINLKKQACKIREALDKQVDDLKQELFMIRRKKRECEENLKEEQRQYEELKANILQVDTKETLMRKFSHNTSKEVRRIRMRLNKEFGDQQKKYQREHEDLVISIEEMQSKIDFLQKEIDSKQQKRQMPNVQKKILENQIARAKRKKESLLQDYTQLKQEIAILTKNQEVKTPTKQSKVDQKMNKKKYTCIICAEGIKEVLFLPCSHMLICRVCNQSMIKTKVDNCIVCGAYIVKRHNIYWGNFIQAKGGSIILSDQKSKSGEIVLE